jgi:hypothetical protein
MRIKRLMQSLGGKPHEKRFLREAQIGRKINLWRYLEKYVKRIEMNHHRTGCWD